jgi:hypothetical protein
LKNPPKPSPNNANISEITPIKNEPNFISDSPIISNEVQQEISDFDLKLKLKIDSMINDQSENTRVIDEKGMNIDKTISDIPKANQEENIETEDEVFGDNAKDKRIYEISTKKNAHELEDKKDEEDGVNDLADHPTCTLDHLSTDHFEEHPPSNSVVLDESAKDDVIQSLNDTQKSIKDIEKITTPSKDQKLDQDNKLPDK